MGQFFYLIDKINNLLVPGFCLNIQIPAWGVETGEGKSQRKVEVNCLRSQRWWKSRIIMIISDDMYIVTAHHRQIQVNYFRPINQKNGDLEQKSLNKK